MDKTKPQRGEEEVKFDNPQEEIAYLRAKLEESQNEFQEFQESSRELEVEYETQIKQLEKKNSESLSQISRLEGENEQLKSKYNAYTSDTQHKLKEYQHQVTELTSMNDRLTGYIRELEQSNDDLERARRALAASLEDFEGQLNQQIERNALLENEVSEKEELECTVQRLKEEARDLRFELIAKKNTTDSLRRKQLMKDNQQLNTSIDTSLQTNDSNNLDDVTTLVGKLEVDGSLNGQSISKSPDLSMANGSAKSKIPNADSTTSPRSTQSRFSFSPFNNSTSSASKSTDSKSQQTSTPSSPTLPSMVMSPSSRISALNLVSDLLRKVGALESKLDAKRVPS